jgi:hypothetical protein
MDKIRDQYYRRTTFRPPCWIRIQNFFSEDFLFLTKSILLERYGTRYLPMVQELTCRTLLLKKCGTKPCPISVCKLSEIVVKFRICHVTLFTLQLVRFATE